MIDRVVARYLARTAANVKSITEEYTEGRKPRMAASDSDMERAIYVGVFIDKMDRQRLIKAFPPVHPQVWADHMTIKFRDNPADSVDASEFPLGKTITMKVVGTAVDTKAQAVVVQPQGIKVEEGRTPHITISTAAGVNPRYTNTLLEHSYVPVRSGMVIRGKVAWWDGNRARTDW